MNGRIVSLALTLVALGWVWHARSFDAEFIADPIGPRAFPLGIGGLLALSSLRLAFGARDGVVGWSRRQVAVMATLGVYVALLRPLGFLVATTALVAIVVTLFGGPWRRGLVAGALACLVVFAIFTYGLAVPLPLGLAFGGR